jgi:hypothetical protein
MYVAVLFTHSWLRWLVLILGFALLVASARALLRKRKWSSRLENLHKVFLGALDLQFILGLLLYFWLSPIAAAARSNMSVAMKEPTLRFFGLEHVVTMLLAIIVAHVGRVVSKRKSGRPQLRRTAITQALWFLLTLAAIPWPGLDIARPLFRSFRAF